MTARRVTRTARVTRTPCVNGGSTAGEQDQVARAAAPRRARSRRGLACLAAALAALLVAACVPARSPSGAAVDVAVTTEILADLVKRVGGERVSVETVVPAGGDPHSYEPTPSDAAKVARADVGFTNHLLLEEHALIKLFDNNIKEGAPNVSLAESAEPYGAHLIPLVEDVGLDVLWLGLAVRGKTANRGADVRISATAVEGPGTFALYVTDALGQPEIYVNSADGIDGRDVIVLPPGAHTHLNWAFSAAGTYRLTLSAEVDSGDGPVRQLGTSTFAFAVGVDPRTVDLGGQRQVLTEGHADLSTDLETGEIFACTASRSCADHVGDVPADQAIIEVPNRAVTLVPDDERFAFLGAPGTKLWELPQAVLGKHVHGEIDPHLWEDVRNAKAYVQVMAATLITVDPDGRPTYEANRDAYSAELDALHGYVAAQIAKIPAANRKLITTHDAFGYLADAYDMEVAGFVVPNPAQEPSAVQVNRLTEAVRNLRVPAVFVEPNLQARASVLRQVAADQGVAVCMLYGDSFDPNIQNYVEMMRHNADELLRCLGKGR